PVDVLFVMPDIGHGHRNVFGERARTVHADSLSVLAEVATTGETVAAPPANNVPFRADNFAGEKIRHVRPDVRHLAHEFMSDDHRHGNGLLRPGVPFVNVQVGAANTSAVHTDQHVV